MYQKLTLQEIPRICFAHAYTTTHYDLSFPMQARRLELTYFEQGNVLRTFEDGTKQPIPEGSFLLYCFKQPYRMTSDVPLCQHITVGFDAAYTITSVSREELLAAQHTDQQPTAYFPVQGIRPEANSPMEALLRRLIARFSLPEAAQELHCTALLLELLAALTDETVRTAAAEEGTLSPSALLYARRAAGYLAAHLSEKITVGEVASQLGISVGYLSTLFKAYTGRSVVDYVNALRVERIRELLVTRHLSLREAGENVGFYDENYASRLFKRYTGQSVRTFQRLGRAETGLSEIPKTKDPS